MNNKEVGIEIDASAVPEIRNNTVKGNRLGIAIKEYCGAAPGVQHLRNPTPEMGSNILMSVREPPEGNNCSGNDFGVTVRQNAAPTLEDNIFNDNIQDGMLFG